MSRRSQDIPIRPRYGISEQSNEAGNTQLPQMPRSRKTSTSAQEMGSSYSEIPFLAQYAGPVPEHALQSMNAIEQQINKDKMEIDEDENESGEDNSNSKDSSYEISKTPKRPNSLHCDSSFPYELEGATSSEGEMRHFVAADLESQLRNASPQNKDVALESQNNTPSSFAKGMMTHRFLQSQGPPPIDESVLSDIEIEAQYLANSVDTLMENLGNLLHSISSITADNVEVHKNAVIKLTDCMDANIKCMYTIMAKTEEISKSMKPCEQLGQRIREIKRLVDILDSIM